MKLLERLETLSKIGLTDHGICRSAGSREDDDARMLIIDWMFEDNLNVRSDEHRNIRGYTEGEGPPIVIGSHIDTVSTAGKYDGVLGVLAGLEVARALGGIVSCPIEVVVFYDEEDTMSGSIGYCAKRPDIKAFLELHVEQGPVLESCNTDIGVVTGIVGQRRCSFTVYGQGNHAGTTPMDMRDDALVKSAPIISYVNQKAMNQDGLVATISQVELKPNAFSVIPSEVVMTMQVRDLDGDNMDDFVDEITQTFNLDTKILHSSQPAMCDYGLMRHIKDSAKSLGLSSMEMPSRASHDAQNFTFCPMAMVFVPSVGGISHSPDEYTSDEMCYNGVNVLIETVRRIDEETRCV